MNAAQMTGMRMTHQGMTPATKTAREMALTSHKLSKDGNRATTPDWATVPSPENVLFGAQLRAWRTSNGLALRELCAHLHCSFSTLVAAEKGGPVSASMARRFEALKAGGPEGVRAMRALEILQGRK